MTTGIDLDVWKGRLWKASPYIVFLLFMVVLHSYLHVRSGDTHHFTFLAKDCYEGEYLEHIAYRWYTWSSRLFTEYLFALFSGLHDVWFKTVDVVLWLFLMWLMSFLCNLKKSVLIDYVLVAGLVTYKMTAMASAGWMPTFVNYLWPFIGLLVSCIPIRMRLDSYSDKAMLLASILAVVSSIYAGNQEQISALGVGMFGVYMFYFWKTEGKIDRLYALITLIFAVWLLLHIICPGNAIRFDDEVNHNPAYASYGLFEVIGVMLSSELARWFFTIDLRCYEVCTLLISIACPYVVWRECGKKEFYISLIPLLIHLSFVCGVGNSLFNPTLIAQNAQENPLMLLFSSLISIVYLLGMMLMLYFAFSDSERFELRYLPSALFFAGYMAKVMSGKSPLGVFVCDRTLFMQDMFVVFILMMLWQLKADKYLTRNAQWGIVSVLILVGGWFYIEYVLPFSEVFHDYIYFLNQ